MVGTPRASAAQAVGWVRAVLAALVAALAVLMLGVPSATAASSDATTVLAAYGVSLVLIAGLVWHTVAANARARRALEEHERNG